VRCLRQVQRSCHRRFGGARTCCPIAGGSRADPRVKSAFCSFSRKIMPLCAFGVALGGVARGRARARHAHARVDLSGREQPLPAERTFRDRTAVRRDAAPVSSTLRCVR
jgi:hypothetical protein